MSLPRKRQQANSKGRNKALIPHQNPGKDLQNPGKDLQNPVKNLQNPGENLQNPGKNLQQESVESSAVPLVTRRRSPAPGVAEAALRLLVIICKGSCALLILALLLNLLVVIVDKAVLGGRISHYIPATFWRDILGR